MLKALNNSLLSLIYPQECRVCKSAVEAHGDGVACAVCWDATRIFNGSEMLCDKCGAFFGDEAAPIPVRCHKCDDHFYDKATAVGIYEKALAASIIDLKAKCANAVYTRKQDIAKGKTSFINSLCNQHENKKYRSIRHKFSQNKKKNY